MRAREFIVEADAIVKTGLKPHKEAESAMPGTHRVAGTADRLYDLNRIMIYVASTDGKKCPPIPRQSWAGKNNTAHPYTRVEAEMLKHAYKLAGAEWQDVLAPNQKNKSIESDEVHKISPINSFKGYT
jgi:hypothetical protein